MIKTILSILNRYEWNDLKLMIKRQNLTFYYLNLFIENKNN